MFDKKTPFGIPADAEVYATKAVMDGERPILFVHHDDEDDWMFFDVRLPKEESLTMAALSQILALDKSVEGAAGLLKDRIAHRASPEDPWIFAI